MKGPLLRSKKLTVVGCPFRRFASQPSAAMGGTQKRGPKDVEHHSALNLPLSFHRDGGSDTANCSIPRIATRKSQREWPWNIISSDAVTTISKSRQNHCAAIIGLLSHVNI
ncbi:hypothetical protein PV05_04857 [Exophiala xenobiotica]|uniref:Uncharacterized protein n=1 Tax=Exophiala xenobiotica TaxID=348802 RepID=A0A0D2EL62_9EURO|nr:uncharacterized protein PV05_04857 [Exophiala xenobiotica]KIW56178.1 hypothetical protein PV05_04857 [Exophiala xenobiotica]